jgi:hypothetical protein
VTFKPGFTAYCPVCGRESQQVGPAIPVWHCEDCQVSLRMTGAQIQAALRRLAGAYAEPDPEPEPEPEPVPPGPTLDPLPETIPMDQWGRGGRHIFPPPPVLGKAARDAG